MATKRILLALALFSAFTLAMLFARVEYASEGTFVFLSWNLFLAWIPIAIGLFLYRAKTRLSFAAIFVPWLLFFPNAAYIVTDLIHIRPRTSAPFWYDVFLLASFAINGLLLGVVSLRFVHLRARELFSPLGGWAMVLFVSAASGYGIYLGRTLRFNTWDVLTNPAALTSDVTNHFVSPSSHPQTWGMTLVMAAIFLCTYFVLCALNATADGPQIREEGFE